MTDFGAILSAFRAVPVYGERYKGYCPLHKGGMERRPSVSLTVRGDKLLVMCWVCGKHATKHVVEAAGFRMSDLFDSPPERRPMAMAPSATFVYTDEFGMPLYRALRYDYPGGGKGFAQQRWDAATQKWLAGIGPAPGTPGATFTTRRVLYRLKDVIDKPEHGVFVAEGEGKADLLAGWGLVTVACVGGSGMGWDDSYSLSIKDRKVAVLPDNDAPGYRHAERVVGSLLRHGAASVRLVILPGLKESEDVADWAKRGGTRDELLRIAKSSPAWGVTA